MKKVAIGQAGGPTSVINFTLAGLVKEIMDEYSIYFIQNGYQGLLNQQLVKGNDKYYSKLFQHAKLPGAFLGAGRYALTEKDMEDIVRYLEKENIETLIFIGGNGTMEALYKISHIAQKLNVPLQTIGLPKTVDNDIQFTDHAPGFGSAAKYVANAVRDLSLDLASMKNFEQVRVIETMGRNAGWLAAASGFLKNDEYQGPHFIALPEKKLDKNLLMETVESAISSYGYSIIVVSEGVLWDNSKQICMDTFNNRTVLGGISREIQRFIEQEFKLNVRAENLGILQRCSYHLVSNIDRNEAYEVGKTGGIYVKNGKSNVMVSINRVEGSNYEIVTVPISLEDVAVSGERLMPEIFLNNLDNYYKWLAPLID